ncbi:MAG: hypothetical protein HQL22_10625 [Candidatus Omnitrophica bacterium]|nr:hypothetical protein [Candidatus Omnitrophota bacterium]
MTKTASSSTFFFWLTVAAGLCLLYPQIDFQGFLSSGDHGRGLYAAERTLHGDVPYQDYWWDYGPLMPYYYAAFDHLLGVNIMSILIAKALLTLASAMCIFLTLEVLAGGLAGFAAAAWFLAFGHDFFYTYNHAGGITCLAFTLFCVASYIKTRQDDWLWTGLVGAFILSLIKLNFGAAAILMLLGTACLTDLSFAVPFTGKKKFFYLFGTILLPLIILAVYWSFLYGLSWAELQQCMPFGRSDALFQSSPWEALNLLAKTFGQNLLANRTDFIFGAIVLTSLLRVLSQLADRERPAAERKESLLTLILLGACYILSLHEYIKSDLWYRTFWAQPAGIVWMFALVALALKNFSLLIRALIFGLLCILCTLHAREYLAKIDIYRTTDHYLADPRGKVFIANPPEWMKTAEDTAEFINRMIPPDETFLALPYDPLYYYLTARRSPTRMLTFFDVIHIPPEQEMKVINELENSRVNFILLSNRIHSQEPGLGIFGQTYCPNIAKYIDANFIPVAKFGDWQNEPGWAWNHGTVILQRKGLRK